MVVSHLCNGIAVAQKSERSYDKDKGYLCKALQHTACPSNAYYLIWYSLKRLAIWELNLKFLSQDRV